MLVSRHSGNKVNSEGGGQLTGLDEDLHDVGFLAVSDEFMYWFKLMACERRVFGDWKLEVDGGGW